MNGVSTKSFFAAVGGHNRALAFSASDISTFAPQPKNVAKTSTMASPLKKQILLKIALTKFRLVYCDKLVRLHDWIHE